jgi:hypothetical protein
MDELNRPNGPRPDKVFRTMIGIVAFAALIGVAGCGSNDHSSSQPASSQPAKNSAVMSRQEKSELRHRAEQEVAAFGREHPRAARRMEEEAEVESVEAERKELRAQSEMEQRDRERLHAAEQRHRHVKRRTEQEVRQMLASPNGQEFCAATPSEIRQFGDRNAIRMYKQYCGKE